ARGGHVHPRLLLAHLAPVGISWPRGAHLASGFAMLPGASRASWGFRRASWGFRGVSSGFGGAPQLAHAHLASAGITGTLAEIAVPAPGRDSTSRRPAKRRTRCRMASKPNPPSPGACSDSRAGSKPAP